MKLSLKVLQGKHRNQHKHYTMTELEHIYRMVKESKSNHEIDLLIPCSDRLFNNMWKLYFQERSESRKLNAMIEVKRQYWESEDEMIIQDYKPEQLKGEELEILNTML